jgi:hypothetical protein
MDSRNPWVNNKNNSLIIALHYINKYSYIYFETTSLFEVVFFEREIKHIRVLFLEYQVLTL